MYFGCLWQHWVMYGKMLFIAIIRKFKFSFKGMAKKPISDTTSNISTIADHFKVPMQATVPIFRRIVSCFMYRNRFCIHLYGLVLADACVIK